MIFFISNLRLDDECEYTITAKNPLGEASSMGRLKVNPVPCIDYRPFVDPEKLFKKLFKKLDLTPVKGPRRPVNSGHAR